MRYKSLREKIIAQLKEIYDPEIPVNLYDLGLIYGIDFAREGSKTVCVVTMTLTSAACPVSESIVNLVANIANFIEDEGEVEVRPNLVFDPPWDREKVSDEAKLHLGML